MQLSDNQGQGQNQHHNHNHQLGVTPAYYAQQPLALYNTGTGAAATTTTAALAPSPCPYWAPEALASVRLARRGQRLKVRGKGWGRVRYVGGLAGKAGVWYGVSLEERNGECVGCVKLVPE
jgi:hypothetical protein